MMSYLPGLKWQKKYKKITNRLESLRVKETKIENEIKKLGGLALLDTSDLYFPSPVKSESRKNKEAKWARWDAEAAERDAESAVAAAAARTAAELREHRRAEARRQEKEKNSEMDNPFELTGVSDDFIPVIDDDMDKPKDEKVIGASNGQDTPKPVVETIPTPLDFSPVLGDIRGADVTLIPVAYDGGYIARHDGMAVVMVDIGGVKVPFYLNNSNGTWKPIYRFNENGKMFLNEPYSHEDPREIKDVITDLNKKFGNNIAVYDLPGLDMDVLASNTSEQIYGVYPNGARYADQGVLKHFLAKVGAQSGTVNKKRITSFINRFVRSDDGK